MFQTIKTACKLNGKGVHYVILSHNQSIESVNKELRSQLKHIAKMKNVFKRKESNDKVFAIICKLEELQDDDQRILNSVIICNDPGDVQLFSLGKKKIAHLTEYNVRPFSMLHGDIFDLDFLEGTIANTHFRILGRIDKDLLCVIEANRWKWKLVQEQPCKNDAQLLESLQNIQTKKTGIVYGGSPHLKKLKDVSNWLIVTKRLDKESAFDELDKDDAIISQQQLDVAMSIVHNENEMHKAIFGNLDNKGKTEFEDNPEEICCAIEQFRVKELYIHESLLPKLHDLFTGDVLNFKIISIRSIQMSDADPGESFLRDYNGIFGVAYY